MRIGIGYDVHRLVPDRPLVLGGVHIPYKQGLAGHSDADVLLHAIIDALLGAAALPDIGRQFPADDPRYAGANSLQLLDNVLKLLAERQWRIVNVDSTILAEAPRLASFIPEMQATIARTLGVEAMNIGIKATTTEGLDAIGAGRGIAAHAVALLMHDPSLQDCACISPR
ncbi:MAG: 2-C-methyl-D-erythritol 2,4-cyclodiphosphate synthase [Chloroflexota bacterium]|nr:2-C-methyl-D-erythritol 2,4-cyclodiphosphate synthase [Chloroflexota bacterium]MDE2841406.1 2-C-methyl-D-erythritol 2,4-cyclodiphosphate synthase [Chloroflexota bacterium]MDE2931312.1 2-C-methyl-D-erythritol 2,4-cyclodiphosphate synthase [Chloroflexota bacterium]